MSLERKCGRFSMKKKLAWGFCGIFKNKDFAVLTGMEQVV